MVKYCAVEGCPNMADASRGWCRKHYARWQRHGDPMITYSNRDLPLIERFFAKVSKDGPPFADRGPCWDWTGATTKGYGNFHHPKGKIATRYIMAVHLGRSLADDEEIDHLCRRPICVNPDHLEAVTHQENGLRGMSPHAINARKTHCIHGHEFTPENTWHRLDDGGRQCKACNNIRQKATQARKQARCIADKKAGL